MTISPRASALRTKTGGIIRELPAGTKLTVLSRPRRSVVPGRTQVRGWSHFPALKRGLFRDHVTGLGIRPFR